MHGPAANALTVLLFGLAGLFLFAAAASWAKVAKERERPDQKPVVPVRALRSAAGITAAALTMLAIASVWLALLSFPWSD
jgi:hypothetical protein